MFQVKTIVQHEMETGYRRDDRGLAIPRHIISRFVVTYNGDRDLPRRHVSRASRPIPTSRSRPRRRSPARSYSPGPTTRAQTTTRAAHDHGRLMRRAAAALAALLALPAGAADDRPSPPRPGRDFQSAETQRMQDDDGANLGMLWVEQGAALWREAGGRARKSCASCHQDAPVSMKGVAARYPRGRCRERRAAQYRRPHQSVPHRAHGRCALRLREQRAARADGLRRLSVARPAARSGRSMAPAQALSSRPGARSTGRGRASSIWPAGNATTRTGASACAATSSARGRRTAGRPTGWSGRRWARCTVGSGPAASASGRRSSTTVRRSISALELYLAWRGEGLPIESPGVRR